MGHEYRHIGATVYLRRTGTRVNQWFDLTPGSEDRRALEILIEQREFTLTWLPGGPELTLALTEEERGACRQAFELATPGYRAERHDFALWYASGTFGEDAEYPTPHRPRTGQRPGRPIA